MTSDATRLQQRIIDGANDSLDRGRDAFLVGPTGCGKTRKFSVIAENRVARGQDVLVLANRRSLVEQSQKAFGRWTSGDVETTYGMDGHVDQSGRVVYCTIQTAHELRDELKPYGAVVFDEAHHVREDNVQYRETIDALVALNPDVRIVPVSATPPEGYEGLHPRLRAADKHIITYEEAIAARLVRLPETRTPAMIYTSHDRIEDVVKRHRRTRTSSELEAGIGRDLARMRGADWAEQTVTQYERQGLADLPTLTFHDSIREATAFVAEARERGHEPLFIHSGMSDRQNDKALDDYREGRCRLLVSVDMISEGIDLDARGILLDKRTTSATQYRQIVGRESRGHGEDGERALLVDLGASTFIHGDIGAQAAMQTLRGGLERRTLTPEEMLPDVARRDGEGFTPWVEVKMPGADRKAWATSIDRDILYAMPTEAGFAAFVSHRDRRGATVQTLRMEGQVNGRPTRAALAAYVADALGRNEQALSRIGRRLKDGTTELGRMVAEDWAKNARSVENMVATMTRYPAAARTAAMATGMTR